MINRRCCLSTINNLKIRDFCYISIIFIQFNMVSSSSQTIVECQKHMWLFFYSISYIFSYFS